MIAEHEPAAALGVMKVLMERPEKRGCFVCQAGVVMQESTSCDHYDGTFLHVLQSMFRHGERIFHNSRTCFTEFRVLRWAA